MRSCSSLILLGALVLNGCSEGGVSGTGSVVDTTTPTNTLVEVSGQANKGPFGNGAGVQARALTGDEAHTAMTSGLLGDFTVSVPMGEAARVDVTGHYFSEITGEMSPDEVTLSGIVMGEADMHANVNTATHIVHERIVDLIDSGMDAETAMAMAESELREAMSDVIPAPANMMRFANLVVMNAAQEGGNPEGNAWLLAMSSMLEHTAAVRAQSSGSTVDSELNGLLEECVQAMRESQMFDSDLIDEMIVARGALNPDEIHMRLMNLDDELRVGSMVMHMGMTQVSAQSMDCDVVGSEIRCSEGGGHMGGGGMFQSMDLENMVANMNRFIDTDGDGIVNDDDGDDDNDGIADEDDDTPYGE